MNDEYDHDVCIINISKKFLKIRRFGKQIISTFKITTQQMSL